MSYLSCCLCKYKPDDESKSVIHVQGKYDGIAGTIIKICLSSVKINFIHVTIKQNRTTFTQLFDTALNKREIKTIFVLP